MDICSIRSSFIIDGLFLFSELELFAVPSSKRIENILVRVSSICNCKLLPNITTRVVNSCNVA